MNCFNKSLERVLDGVTVARDQMSRIEAEVAKLPPMQRNVFLMRAQQGEEYESIAAALGTTVGAARVHYHQAVKRLRAAMEGEGG